MIASMRSVYSQKKYSNLCTYSVTFNCVFPLEHSWAYSTFAIQKMTQNRRDGLHSPMKAPRLAANLQARFVAQAKTICAHLFNIHHPHKLLHLLPHCRVAGRHPQGRRRLRHRWVATHEYW